MFKIKNLRVRENISKFGGDKNGITMLGSSSGAHAASIHLTHEDSFEYFDSAILIGTTT